MTEDKPKAKTKAKQRRDIETRFKSNPDLDLASRPFCVRLPKAIDEAIREKPDSTVWAREVLSAALKNDLDVGQSEGGT
jgi:hypothetical protein